MRIEYFDNLVDYCVMDEIYRFSTDSSFRLGWKDGTDEKRTLNNLHSNWSFEDLKNSQLLPFVNTALKKSKNFNHLDETAFCKIFLSNSNITTIKLGDTTTTIGTAIAACLLCKIIFAVTVIPILHVETGASDSVKTLNCETPFESVVATWPI